MCKENNKALNSLGVDDTLLYPRKCSGCGKGMNSGYIIGFEWYCDRDDSACRKKIFSDKEWAEHYTDDGDDCWTTWECLEKDINYTNCGLEVHMFQCCSKIDKKDFEANLELLDSNTIESEIWRCFVCKKKWEVNCYIQREWDDVEEQKD